jgi:hypothetical protein
MSRWILAFAAAALLLGATDASAQRRSSSSSRSSFEPRIELIPHAGYAWTFEREAYYGAFTGKLDIKDSGFWGIAADIPVRPDKQIRLLYRRQDSEIVFRRYGGGSYEQDLATEYYHIGGVGGIRRGNVLPYGLLTLGGTRYANELDDIWKFSMIFGLGAKVYGERFGFMAQASFPFTVTEGGGYISVGSGGLYTTVGGTGIGQFDLSAGLIVRL